MTSWTDPPDFDVGQLVTEAHMDNISGNLNFLFELLDANVLDVRNANVPLSGISAAGLQQVESASTDTYKPTWHELTFDADTDEARMWTMRSWFASSDITGLKIEYTMDTDNTSKTAVMRVQLAAMSDGDTGMASKSFDTDNDTTISVPDTGGELDVASLPLTNFDGVTYGDEVILFLGRIGTDSSDNASGDLKLRRLWFYK